MAVPALKSILLTTLLLLVLLAASGFACFGPKLFIGVVPGLEGEMRYHLVSIYLHEKTGIDSILVELKAGQTAEAAILAKEIDLGYSREANMKATEVLRLADGYKLYSGERPLNDLQFTTAGRAFAKLQKRLDAGSLDKIRARILTGTLPATAVRDFMLNNGWI
jgi:hypothetical protein